MALEPESLRSRKAISSGGAVLAIEYDEFYLLSVFSPLPTPSAKMYRSKKWDNELIEFAMSLEKKKPLICPGVFNVVNQDIDFKFVILISRVILVMFVNSIQ